MDRYTMDLAAVQAENLAARSAAVAGKPMFGIKSLRYYLQHIPDHFIKSVNPMPAIKTAKPELMGLLKKEFGQLFKLGGGLFALGADLAFTTVPGAWEKFKTASNPLVGIRDAMGELVKGSVLAAGGLGAAAAYAALFPAVGLPGLILSNVIYEGGKKLVSQLTGLKQDSVAPYINPDKLAGAGGNVDQFIKQAGDAASTASPGNETAAAAASAVPGDPRAAFNTLSPESKANLEAALKSSGTTIQAFLAK